METKTTTKKLLGIAYLLQEQKIYSDEIYASMQRKVTLVQKETYLFDIKIHTTQITF